MSHHLNNLLLVYIVDSLMMYLETLSEFDPLVSEFSLRDTEKSIGWALTARDSSNSIELMEEMWSQMLLNNDRTPALLKRGHGQFSTAAVCLYNHLIDMASVDGIRGDVRKSSLQLLRYETIFIKYMCLSYV